MVNYAKPGLVSTNSTTLSLPTGSAANPLVIGGKTTNRAMNGGLVIASSAITAEEQATIAGHIHYMAGDSGATALRVGRGRCGVDMLVV